MPEPPPADLDLDAIEARLAEALESVWGWPTPWRIIQDDVPALLAEVRRLRAERDAWKELARPKGPLLSDNWRTEEMLEERVAELEVENERLRAALAHYADEDNWTRSSFDLLDWYSAGPPGSNGFDVARAALAEG